MKFIGKRKVNILTIDGGGIRGIIPATILKHLEDILEYDRRKTYFAREFDLIAGTSTGGLLALAMALPRLNPDNGKFTGKPRFTASELVDFYMERGTEIFPRDHFTKLRTVAQVFSEKYESRQLEALLSETFGEATLKDGLTNLLITSYDMENNQPFVMKKRPKRKRFRDDLNFYMKDAARATSAAPTYFEPAWITSAENKEKHYCLVDGGVFANNPAMCAYIEARKLYPSAKEFTIVALGTGTRDHGFKYSSVKTWGYLDWVSPLKDVPLSSVMSNGQSRCISHQLNRLPEVNYFRINGLIPDTVGGMDDTRPENLENLQKAAEKIIKTNEEIFISIRDHL